MLMVHFSTIFNLIKYILYVDCNWAIIRCTTLRYLHSYIGCSNLFTSSLFREKRWTWKSHQRIQPHRRWCGC